ncbi:MarR family winged helix-turn-helix transcriptional regulator [Sneathiella chinensis]|uniref:Transcriptional regulator n=1 Tax=Sneathiella chinensis TaxID=349750 RepID=A0ABQ5U530_9PROT|nr:MarR family winged helix-turn-helix transcriptional regulator [Sneathiella chinensis]GLQ06348.1 transcriptional regulator [Sneathiella chinensis]
MTKPDRTHIRDIWSPAEDSWDISANPAPDSDQPLDLATFLPYRLSILNIAVSKALSELYADRFHLTRHEWRILAALGNHQPLSGTELGRITSMEKMTVSRAVNRLRQAGLVSAHTNSADRRQKTLHLTDQGTAVYNQIIPLAREREAAILSALSKKEYQTLNHLMEKIFRQATRLQQQDDQDPA